MSLLARIRSKNLQAWLPGYGRYLIDELRERALDVRDHLGDGPAAILDAATRGVASGAEPANGPRHLLVALCDHYEPLWGKPDISVGEARVRAWTDRYPPLADDYRDADGKPPQHSFFFPGEEYAPQFLDALADMARRGYGEVELHVHHDGDTSASLREMIERYLRLFADHGHISRDLDGRLRYAFIHGNWALANSRQDRRWCGVDDELQLLWDTGCYVDMTFPAAPSECQPNIVNRIYWPTGDLSQRRSYDSGERARVGARHDDRLLMITGPLALSRRPGKLALRIDSGAIDGTDPPSASRVRTWAAQNIHIAGRPEWVFVKVHTHGCPEANAATLLGDGGRALHDALTRGYNDGRRWRLHYVTAREMYNIALAAIDGNGGDPNDYRDYRIAPPPVRG